MLICELPTAVGGGNVLVIDAGTARDCRRQTVTSLDETMVTGNGTAARYSSSPVRWAVC
jgi:hypothetical protein